MVSKATTVVQYLAELPPDRREAIGAVRKVFLDNLDEGIEERMSYGMIGYAVPHSIYPAGYHCDPKQPLPYGGLASQKQHMSLYLFCLYGSATTERWFRERWAKTGKKLDMGKSCIRFKRVEDLALDVIGEAIRRVGVREHVAMYEAALGDRKPAAAKKPVAAVRAAKRSAKGKAAKGGKAGKAAKR
jgi:hypothetical protein